MADWPKDRAATDPFRVMDLWASSFTADQSGAFGGYHNGYIHKDISK